MTSLENSASDYACLLNDIFSYQKEIEFEGEFHNGVLVAEHFLGCTRERAVAVVNELMTARMRQFEHTIAVELPALADDFGLDASEQQQLRTYVEGLQHWMSGILRWHRSVKRYTERYLRERHARHVAAPRGLGTTAAQLTAQLGAARLPDATPSAEHTPLAAAPAQPIVPGGPTGLGTAAAQIIARRAADADRRQA